MIEHYAKADFFIMRNNFLIRFIPLLLICLLSIESACSADCEFGVDLTDKSYVPLVSSASITSLSHKITTTVQGILFDSNYDNGSLLSVQSSGANIFNCEIYTEPGEIGNRKYWFRFKMTGLSGKTITLNIEHIQNPRPVISYDSLIWRRMTSTEAPNNNQVILTFGNGTNSAELAFFYPMGFAETYQRVSTLVNGKTYAQITGIGQSYQGRNMLMVSVTDNTIPDNGKKRVWMHSRAHAGEVTSTHSLLGFLDQILENTELGQRLRYYCIFNIVPLQNCDGVYLGLTRWDSQGIDPERQWPDPYRIPEVGNIKDRVDEFMTGPNPIEVGLNMHSTVSNFTDTFFFKHIYPSVTYAFETIQQNYIDALVNATPLFNNLSPQTSQLSPTLFIESYFWNNWGESVMAMTHEGHYYRRITDSEYITDADYYELGKAMAVALIEYFDLPELPTELTDWYLY